MRNSVTKHCKMYGSIRSRKKVENDRARLGRTADDSDYGAETEEDEVPVTQPVSAKVNTAVGGTTAEPTDEEDSIKDTNEVTTSPESGGGSEHRSTNSGVDEDLFSFTELLASSKTITDEDDDLFDAEKNEDKEKDEDLLDQETDGEEDGQTAFRRKAMSQANSITSKTPKLTKKHVTKKHEDSAKKTEGALKRNNKEDTKKSKAKKSKTTMAPESYSETIPKQKSTGLEKEITTRSKTRDSGL